MVDARDARGLSQAKAVVVARPGYAGGAVPEELRQFLAERLAPYKVPQLWELADALPRTATGKVQRFVLRG